MTADLLVSDLGKIRQLVTQGQLPAASALCTSLLESFPKDPRAWNLAAEVAFRSKRPREGEEFLRRAVECAPDDGLLLIQYGQCLLRFGRRQQALAVAVRADGTELTSPWLEDALGTLLTHLEEPLRALPHFERAVADAPSNIDFRYNLAMAQRMAGQLEAAEVNLDKVIIARPDDAEAYHARSDLRRQTPDHNHVSQLDKVLHRLSSHPASLPVAFALAKELEDLREYARSFAHLQDACHRYRASLRYDVADDVAVLDKLRATHTRAVLDELRAEFDNQECIFIIGLPRSGTTLVERIVGGHPDVFAAGELDAFPRVAVDAVGRQGKPVVTKLEFVERALTLDFEALGPQYLEATRPRTGHTKKFTDKLPLNYLYAGLIHVALPRARFIALHRHPLDSCYAMYKTLFAAAYPFTYDLQDLGRYYVAWERLMRHWSSVIGNAWLPVAYEELVSNPERVSQTIVAHCGLVWDTRCLDFHTSSAGVTTASAAQVRRPLYTDSIGKWRRYAPQLASLENYLESNGVSIPME
jgi:tetratricopeptide (TPR) repeat protein